jgi:hypothetical protein
MRYLVLAILAALIVATAAPAYPHAGDRQKEAVSIEVVSESGAGLLSIPQKDFWNGNTHVIRKYLEAKKGENYALIVRNRTAERVGVVIAVDGRNIISGKKSDLRNTEDMYIVNGYDQARYDGWRTARDTVHKFYFTDTADSYSVRAFEDSSAMGVIAVAVYREKERPKPMDEIKRKNSAQPAPSAGSLASGRDQAAREESAGTGFGEGQYSPARMVVFEPETLPLQKTLVKYEWRDVLCKRGIISCRQEGRNRLWDDNDFAPFPPGYWGR